MIEKSSRARNSGSVHTDGTYRIDALAKGIAVLKCLGENPEPLSLKDICAITQFPKATVFRYLHTLCAEGLITHDPKLQLYRIDVRIAEKLGINAALEGLRAICLPYMEALFLDVERFKPGTIVNLGVVEGMDVVYLDVIGSSLAFRLHSYVGSRHPVHTTALGKVMLAHMSPEARLAALPKVLRRRTHHSIVDKEVLNASLERILKDGYAEEAGENEEGASCIGAPIFNSSGLVVAGLSISARSLSIPSEEKHQRVAALLHTTDQISHSLGRAPRPPSGSEIYCS